MTKSGYSKTNIYKLFSLLCRFGFSEYALTPGYASCGAPGVKRPCGPDQKKVGAKTIKEKIQIACGEHADPEQPGMTEEWSKRIIAADGSLRLPKPPMSMRVRAILDNVFVTDYAYIQGQREPLGLTLGKYPNSRQIARVLKTHYSKIERYLHKTTKNNFTLNHRGLEGVSWEGVAGPGHTYAIDSTVGDVYLRSSINRNWFVGRPIVYVIVDVWSGAVVGFYVCLVGPSWDMAKIALFCACASPQLIARLRGVEFLGSLSPYPTLPAVILSDRGESLSKGASITGITINLLMHSYTPPYRGDYKGNVESLVCIKKDENFLFVPGAINARRAEYELRKFDYRASLLTVREYAHLLHHEFHVYNLTAQRNKRLDSHMIASDVDPSPAGLWRWGHEVGIGTQLYRDQSELVASLLPKAQAKVTRRGLELNGLHYSNKTQAEAENATLARNGGNWDTSVHYYPGSVSTIWSPSNEGMTEISLVDHSRASPELTLDEYNDGNAYALLNKQEREHKNLVITLGADRNKKDIVDNALKELAMVQERSTEEIPKATEARNLEKAAVHFLPQPDPEQIPAPQENDEAQQRHSEELQKLYEETPVIGVHRE